MTETLCICVCTFQRTSVLATLKSIAAQCLPDDVAINVVVADNDEKDSARPGVEAEAQSLGLALRYIHAPARNISIARNACLDTADSDWLVFIDDDEEATPDWIAQLLDRRAANQFVFGVSQALYEKDTAHWLIEGDFHSNRLSGNDAAWNGYTANVLMDRRFIVANGLRFAIELGQTGGEDTLFFYQAFRAGARFGYAPDAVVFEKTMHRRANIQWLGLRRFRAGQIHYRLLQHEGHALRASLMAVLKLGFSAVRATLALPRPALAAGHALRAMLHLGVVAASLGLAPYREYRS